MHGLCIGQCLSRSARLHSNDVLPLITHTCIILYCGYTWPLNILSIQFYFHGRLSKLLYTFWSCCLSLERSFIAELNAGAIIVRTSNAFLVHSTNGRLRYITVWHQRGDSKLRWTDTDAVSRFVHRNGWMLQYELQTGHRAMRDIQLHSCLLYTRLRSNMCPLSGSYRLFIYLLRQCTHQIGNAK